MKNSATLVATGLLALAAHAGTPDKLAAAAGPQPSEAVARRAVANQLVRLSRESADMTRVRFLSGPRLVTGINFAGNREQAWQVCVITGDSQPRRGPLDLEVQPYLLRNGEAGVTVIQANWKESDRRC